MGLLLVDCLFVPFLMLGSLEAFLNASSLILAVWIAARETVGRYYTITFESGLVCQWSALGSRAHAFPIIFATSEAALETTVVAHVDTHAHAFISQITGVLR